jgi:hypothetical protein
MSDNSERLIHRNERAGSGWFRDRDGVFTTVQDEDETNTYTFDYNNHLNSGETVSTSTWANEGVTTSSASISSGVASVKITGTNGQAKNTIVTSTARTLIYRYRFVAPQSANPSQGYQTR